MIHHRFDLHRLPHVIDVSGDAIFVAADIEDRGRPTCVSGCNIRLAESRLRVLKILPVGLASDPEPVFKCAKVLFSLRFSLTEFL